MRTGSRPTWRYRWIICAGGFAIAAFGAASGVFQNGNQSSSARQTPIFQSERNEVEVVVIVRDKKGQPVRGLKREDFEIRDNGKVQTIGTFAIQDSPEQTTTAQTAPTSPAPPAESQVGRRRFVALFFDDMHTQPGDFGRMQKAAAEFVQQSLQPEDRVAVFKASENRDVTFTNDKAKLLAAINALRVRPVDNSTKSEQCPRMSQYEAYLIVNELDPEALEIVAGRLRDCFCPPPASGCPLSMDDVKRQTQGIAQASWQTQKDYSQMLLAALDFAVRALATMPGRRMLMLSSSGFLSGNLDNDIDRVIDNALRGGVVMNTLSAKGLWTESPGGELSEQRTEGSSGVGLGVSMYEVRQFDAQMEAENTAMIDFAESTGGRFFKNNNDFLRGFNELALPETSYVLGFSPNQLKHDGKFHQLKIAVKAPGTFSVSARHGYFASTEKDVEAARSGGVIKPPPPTPPRESEAPAAIKPATTPPEKTPAETAKAAVSLPSSATPTASAKPASTEDTSSEAGTNTSTPPPGSVTGKSPSLSAAMEEEVTFLKRAAREVQHYIEAFGDLTADETRVMQTYDASGIATAKRTMQSALVVYRLRTDPKKVIEYRDVMSVDGREIKDHAARAEKIWKELAAAHSPEEEVKRIADFSERFDLGLGETGFTLFEGLPLRGRCSRDFAFHEVRDERVGKRALRIFAYRQLRPCDAIRYRFIIPRELADWSLVQGGEIALEADTAQVVREERNVYAAHMHQKTPVAHVVLEYGESSFGILVPKTILIETFLLQANGLTGADGRLLARMVQTYGPFSRFEVSTLEKTSASAQ